MPDARETRGLGKPIPRKGSKGGDYVNKIVTLGTPHRGIAFQVVRNWIRIEAQEELDHFDPDFQKDAGHDESYVNFGRFFPPDRLLCIVGTNYRTYGPVAASWLNRVFSAPGEFGANYNRSDGLVKQISAQIPGAPRTFVHKCHGGPDSLVTSRETFEIATRFLFGNLRVRLHLVEAKVKRGLDTSARSLSTDHVDDLEDIVMRLDFYVGERDTFGIGFSDNVIFRKQYYARALFGSLEGSGWRDWSSSRARVSPGLRCSSGMRRSCKAMKR